MTVTQLVKFGLIVFPIMLFSCSSMSSDMTNPWIVKGINKSTLVDKSFTDIDEVVLKKIFLNFAENPYYEGYSELKYSAAYYRDDDRVDVIIFDNVYVDDIKIVYELNESDIIIDRYIYSEWK